MTGPVVVTGTGTEVGKTWVSCEVLRSARADGSSVAARKPLQSFSVDGGPTDSELLAAASGELPDVVGWSAWSYPVPMAPPMAASVLGRPVPSLAEVVAGLEGSWPAGGCDLRLVEGAGGVASPLTFDGDTAALARALGAARVILVADAGLGVINSVRLSAAVLGGLPLVVHLNRFDAADDLHRRNGEWLGARDGFDLTTSIEELLVKVRA